NGITGVHAGRLKVAVTQAPEKGKANQALVKLLAELLDIKRSQIALVAGETSHHKKFLITGIDRATLEQRLAIFSPPSQGGAGGVGGSFLSASGAKRRAFLPADLRPPFARPLGEAARRHGNHPGEPGT